jgi:hypothetical protein
MDITNIDNLLTCFNLKKYKYQLCVANIHLDIYNILDNNSLYKNFKTIYYILDNPGDYALVHFVFETFIFINLLRELNNKIDNVKIVTSNNKKYVKNLLNFFNIHNEVVYEIDNYNNICYYPKIYSLNNKEHDIIHDDYYNIFLNYYSNYIKINLKNFDNLNYSKLIFLPRNDFENYVHNDRIINNKDVIKNLVINKGGEVIDTYRLNNIHYQFSLINYADVIILDFGSSYFFNCIFLENKKIYILDDTGMITNQFQFISIRFLYNIIAKKNKIIITNTTDILNILIEYSI